MAPQRQYRILQNPCNRLETLSVLLYKLWIHLCLPFLCEGAVLKKAVVGSPFEHWLPYLEMTKPTCCKDYAKSCTLLCTAAALAVYTRTSCWYHETIMQLLHHSVTHWLWTLVNVLLKANRHAMHPHIWGMFSFHLICINMHGLKLYEMCWLHALNIYHWLFWGNFLAHS